LIIGSSLSAPFAIIVIGSRKISLEKNININEYLLKILLNYAEYLPVVSPKL
jgi:hypothetical protein